MCQYNQPYNQLLETTAQLGYNGIELGGFEYGMLQAKELKYAAESYGLEIVSAHISCENPVSRLKYLSEAGLSRAVIASAVFADREAVKRFAEQLCKWSDIFAQNGIGLGYHNHTQEFYVPVGENETLHEMLLQETKHSSVRFQFDAGWASCAGIDVVSYLNRYKERFYMMHITESNRVFGAEMPEDFPKDSTGKRLVSQSFKTLQFQKREANCRLGQGINDWPMIIEAGKKQGISIFINERRHSYTEDLYMSLAEDVKYLKEI